MKKEMCEVMYQRNVICKEMELGDNILGFVSTLPDNTPILVVSASLKRNNPDLNYSQILDMILSKGVKINE